MDINNYSCCCTMLELGGFGEDCIEWPSKQPTSPSGKDLKTFIKNLEARILDFDDDNYDHWESEECNEELMFRSRAILIATTIDSQKIPAGYLEQLGFKRALTNVRKVKHSETKLTLWCIRIPKLLKNIAKLKETV